MTAVSSSRRCALMNAYLHRISCDLRRLPIDPPLVLTTTPKVYVKSREVQGSAKNRGGHGDTLTSLTRKLSPKFFKPTLEAGPPSGHYAARRGNSGSAQAR